MRVRGAAMVLSLKSLKPRISGRRSGPGADVALTEWRRISWDGTLYQTQFVFDLQVMVEGISTGTPDR
jgi:hypothetical protein